MKNQKGITLIALIITIIVMLILVAVAVTTAVNSGLLGHAGNATQGWKNSEETELNLDNKINTTLENGTVVTGINDIVNFYKPATGE